MLIPIPYAVNYTSTISGVVVKVVTCEQCGAGYAYQLQRAATQTETSWFFFRRANAADRAESKAKAALTQNLERGVDVVPCPTCGRYQQHMLLEARKLRRRWLYYLGSTLNLGLLPVIAICGIINGLYKPQMLPWPTFLGIFAALLAFGFACMFIRCFLARNYDPNHLDVEERKKLGQLRAITRSAFEQGEMPPQPGGLAPLNVANLMPQKKKR